MTATKTNDTQPNIKPGFFWNTGSLIFTGISAVLVGFIVPVSAAAFDVLLIFSVTLTATLALISVLAKNTFETSGFSISAVLTSALQIALAASVAEHLFMHRPVGNIVYFAERVITSNRYVNMASIYVAVALFLTTLEIMRKKIVLLINNRTRLEDYISPIRRIGIEGMSEKNLISDLEAEKLFAAVSAEKLFHRKNTKAAFFILSCALFESLVAASIIFNNITDNAVVSMAIGSASILYISAFVSLLSCAHLSGKNAPIEISSDTASPRSRTEHIEIICDRSDEPEDIIDASFVSEPVCADIAHRTDADIPDTVLEPTSGDDLPLQPATGGPEFWTCKSGTSETAHKTILKGVSEGKKIILMASSDIRDLPVTVAVDTAMKTVRTYGKCLLVDFDFVHNSASKVFGLTAPFASGMVTCTCISGLHLFSAGRANINNISAFNNTMSHCSDRYDAVLIYAPAVTGLATMRQLAACIDGAMLFSPCGRTSSDSTLKFYETLKDNGVSILNPDKNILSAHALTI